MKSDKAKRQATSLTSAEVNHLLAKGRASLDFQDYALILTALRSGLRQGEIAGLEWSDLHFGEDEKCTDRFILVQRSYDRRWSRSMLTPKNHKSRRVDMSREPRRTLLELKAMARDVESKLVFPSASGTPTEMNNFYARVFKPLVKQAGLRPVRFHDLRHTFGSLLIQAGASLAYVRDQMCHSSIQITVDVYGHLVVQGTQISFVDKLDSPTCPQESARKPKVRWKGGRKNRLE